MEMKLLEVVDPSHHTDRTAFADIDLDGVAVIDDAEVARAILELDGRQIDYEINNGVVEVYYIRELRHRFNFATGEALSLDDYES